MFKKFKVRDVIFLAVLAAVYTLFGGLAMPVMRSEIFGLQTLVTCAFYSLFGAVALMKVRKPGTLTIYGLFTGFPLLFMAPVMFSNNFIGGLIAECVVLLIFRGYEKKVAVIAGSALWMVLTVPLSLPFSIWFNGSSYEHFKATAVWQTAIIFIGVITLSLLGAFAASKFLVSCKRRGSCGHRKKPERCSNNSTREPRSILSLRSPVRFLPWW